MTTQTEEQMKAFEEAMLKNGWNKAQLNKDIDGSYQNHTVGMSWWAWQAAIAANASKPTPTENVSGCLICASGNDIPDGEWCRACGFSREGGLARGVRLARGSNEPPKFPIQFGESPDLKAAGFYDSPVAWIVKAMLHEGNTIDASEGGIFDELPVGTKLYTAPPSTQALVELALREAAKFCSDGADYLRNMFPEDEIALIRADEAEIIGKHILALKPNPSALLEICLKCIAKWEGLGKWCYGEESNIEEANAVIDWVMAGKDKE